MITFSDFTSEDVAIDAHRQFVIKRAGELAQIMDRFNTPGDYPSNQELQEWAGQAAAILKMVAEDA